MKMACIGTTSTHNGSMISASATKFKTPSGSICLEGDLHSCPIIGHGNTTVTKGSTLAKSNNKLVLVEGSIAGCGAVLNNNFASKIN